MWLTTYYQMEHQSKWILVWFSKVKHYVIDAAYKQQTIVLSLFWRSKKKKRQEWLSFLAINILTEITKKWSTDDLGVSSKKSHFVLT